MSDQPLAHQILGRYQLLVPVARGGMGQVWLARLRGARGFRKVVAVKTLLSNAEDRPRLEAMLAEEARLAGLIHHANVVHTIELGEHEGLLYLVMEWVDGEPLGFVQERARERGGMPQGVAVALVAQVLSGLHAAHELSDETGPLGVVHRDVSPHNILVTYEGVAKLLDFGIAKATEQASKHTQTGEIKGKFSYMAPEQILGDVVDRRCDVFAAGIVLYWLTTGQHPFKHPNTATIIHTITSAAAVPLPTTLVADYPEALERVVAKALAKSRDERFATAAEMRAALEQAMPEAFDDAGRGALAAFMTQAIGDRRAARREAIRRAQLDADRGTGSGAQSLPAASSQSASSLGAISLSQPAPDASAPPPSAEAASRAVRPRTPKTAWLAAMAGSLLVLGAVLFQGLGRESPPRSAASGVSPGASLPTAAARVVEHAPAAPPLPSASDEPRAAAAPSARPGASRPGVSRTAVKPKPAAPTKARAPSASDLLTPDY